MHDLDYESRTQKSDNEYLYKIDQKLGHTNTRLSEINITLRVLIVVVLCAALNFYFW